MSRGSLDAHIALAHYTAFARVGGELELVLKYDTVIDGYSTVERRFEAWTEVYDADDGAGFDVWSWFYFCKIVSVTHNFLHKVFRC